MAGTGRRDGQTVPRLPCFTLSSLRPTLRTTLRSPSRLIQAATGQTRWAGDNTPAGARSAVHHGSGCGFAPPEHSRIMVSTTLIPGLAFITFQAIALVTGLPLVTQLPDIAVWGNPLLQLFDL